MKENNLEISKEELKKAYHIQKMIYETEEKFLLKKILLYATKRVLDIRDVKEKISLYKNEKLEDFVNEQYLVAVTELMNVIYNILNEPPYCFLFEDDIDLEDYMVLVNGLLLELKPYNTKNIDIDTILIVLDESIFDYIQCLKEESDYSSGVNENEYVYITQRQEDNDEQNYFYSKSEVWSW